MSSSISSPDCPVDSPVFPPSCQMSRITRNSPFSIVYGALEDEGFPPSCPYLAERSVYVTSTFYIPALVALSSGEIPNIPFLTL